jgi:hypothetical protein
MSAANSDLRAALDAITNDKVLLKDHLPRIAALARDFPHKIIPQPATHTPGFNCFAYAFGLWDQLGYRRIAAAEHVAGENRFFASSAFARGLFHTDALDRVCRRDCRAGDIVLYGAEAQPLHAARLIEGQQVQSKWGRGHLYAHALWEVPARYGHTVRFCRPTGRLSFDVAFDQFVQGDPAWANFVATFLG